MDRIRIRGGRPLSGEISISGAKNAALLLMAASLLSEETLTLSNLPHLVDITTLANLLVQLGVEIRMNGAVEMGPKDGPCGRVLELTAREVTNTEAPYDLVRKMRASVLVLGPLLARAGHAKVSLPGGCAIGTRPIDTHLKGLEALGAEIEGGHVGASASERGDQRHPVLEGSLPQDFGQCVLDRAVAAVDDEELDFLTSQHGQSLGHRQRAVGLDAHDIGVALEEAQQARNAVGASTCPEVVQ